MAVKNHLLGVITRLIEDDDTEYYGTEDDVSTTDTNDTSDEGSADEDSDTENKCSDGYDMGGGSCCKKTHFSGQRTHSDENEYILDGVKMLTDISIDTDTDYPKLILVYAPWCGYCIQFKPEYQNLADKLKSENKTVYAINGDGSDVMRQFQLEGFPSVICLIKFDLLHMNKIEMKRLYINGYNYQIKKRVKC